MLIGEVIALIVAACWTATALFAEAATRLIGSLALNVWRMALSILFLGTALWLFTGTPIPTQTSAEVWVWLLASGCVGYAFGDYCLFNSYIVMGSRLGQLFMTLASPFAALAAWIILGETLQWNAILGMMVTLLGIGITIMGRSEGTERMSVNLPLKGISFGIGAAMGQGVGLVLSKVGMECYSSIATDAAVVDMIPVSGTMIRAVAGFVCFGLTIVALGRYKELTRLTESKKAVGTALGAILLGPVVGVSLSLKAVQLAPAGIAQTLMSLTPVLILWPSVIFFGGRITMRDVIGTLIAFSGVCLFFV